MPRGKTYRRRSRAPRRRRRLANNALIAAANTLASHNTAPLHPAVLAAHGIADSIVNYGPKGVQGAKQLLRQHSALISQMKSRTPPWTGSRARSGYGARQGRGRPIRDSKVVKLTDAARHEKLSSVQATPMHRGKGFSKSRLGTMVTHPNAKIPKWKVKRLRDYKYDVWQTVLLSKSNRLPASNNTLQTTRYPIKMPETLDNEKTMSCIFTPFCSHWSGTHSTMLRKVNGAGTDLEHDTSLLFDVVQQKADVARHDDHLVNKLEGSDADPIIYQGSAGSSATAGIDNQSSIYRYFDQLVKEVKIDLVFMASRAFPVVCSVSLVRAVTPQAPYTLSTNDKRELCNGVGNHGMTYATWRTEFFHEFTLPALKVGKKIPTYSINKTIKTNFLQTNSFNQNTTASDMSQAGATALGSNIHSHIEEVSDGFISGNFYILIKYRKKQQPQQFTYTQVIEADSDATSSRFASASVELPVVTEESFDVPTHNGITGAGTGFEDGAPLTNNQGNESKASFYLNGKLKYRWGFRRPTESIPSIMNSASGSADYKKNQSLMIDPTFDGTNQTYGIYQQSPNHVNIAASTANTGP